MVASVPEKEIAPSMLSTRSKDRSQNCMRSEAFPSTNLIPGTPWAFALATASISGDKSRCVTWKPRPASGIENTPVAPPISRIVSTPSRLRSISRQRSARLIPSSAESVSSLKALESHHRRSRSKSVSGNPIVQLQQHFRLPAHLDKNGIRFCTWKDRGR